MEEISFIQQIDASDFCWSFANWLWELHLGRIKKLNVATYNDATTSVLVASNEKVKMQASIAPSIIAGRAPCRPKVFEGCDTIKFFFVNHGKKEEKKKASASQNLQHFPFLLPPVN